MFETRDEIDTSDCEHAIIFERRPPSYVLSSMDNRTPESRSTLMARIGPRNTAPELTVRRVLHRLGYRFRLHRRDLPGTPDIVLPSRKIAIFVHGCFWHAHGCKIGMLPKSNTAFWRSKFDRNRERDKEKIAALETLGWRATEIWQCQTRDTERLAQHLIDFIGPAGKIRSTTIGSGAKRSPNEG